MNSNQHEHTKPIRAHGVEQKSNRFIFFIMIFAFLSGGFLSMSMYLQSEDKPRASKLLNGGAREKLNIGERLSNFYLDGKSGSEPLFTDDGKIRILYFGYTQCPDVCPTSLSVLATALYKLSPNLLLKIKPVFISVDPSRDSIERMSEYVAFFHPQLEGARAEKKVIEPLAQELGVVYKYVELPDSAMEYAVDHSSYFYFLDDKGHLLKTIPHTYEPKPISEAINDLIK